MCDIWIKKCNTNHKCRCNQTALFQGVGAKADLQHVFLLNETGHMQATADVFLTFKVDCFRVNIAFK